MSHDYREELIATAVRSFLFAPLGDFLFLFLESHCHSW